MAAPPPAPSAAGTGAAAACAGAAAASAGAAGACAGATAAGAGAAAAPATPTGGGEAVELETIGYMALKRLVIAHGVPKAEASAVPTKGALKELAIKHGAALTFV